MEHNTYQVISISKGVFSVVNRLGEQHRESRIPTEQSQPSDA